MKIAVSFGLVGLVASTASAWTTHRPVYKASARRSTSKLYNIPPPSLDDKDAFKAYADKQAPPASFFELQQDCVKAATLALRDGKRLLEIEFPPLPANVLEMDDVSAYEIANANLNLALDFAKGVMAATKDDEKSFKKIAILLPDEAEEGIAVEKMLGGSRNPYPGIQVAALRQSEEGDDRLIKVRQLTGPARVLIFVTSISAVNTSSLSHNSRSRYSSAFSEVAVVAPSKRLKTLICTSTSLLVHRSCLTLRNFQPLNLTSQLFFTT